MKVSHVVVGTVNTFRNVADQKKKVGNATTVAELLKKKRKKAKNSNLNPYNLKKSEEQNLHSFFVMQE